MLVGISSRSFCTFGFGSIFLSNGYYMEGTCPVDSREDLAIGEPGQVVFNVGEREGVLDGDFI